MPVPIEAGSIEAGLVGQAGSPSTRLSLTAWHGAARRVTAGRAIAAAASRRILAAPHHHPAAVRVAAGLWQTPRSALRFETSRYAVRRRRRRRRHDPSLAPQPGRFTRFTVARWAAKPGPAAGRTRTLPSASGNRDPRATATAVRRPAAASRRCRRRRGRPPGYSELEFNLKFMAHNAPASDSDSESESWRRHFKLVTGTVRFGRPSRCRRAPRPPLRMPVTVPRPGNPRRLVAGAPAGPAADRDRDRQVPGPPGRPAPAGLGAARRPPA
jgi:hypothetical protein